MRVSHIIATKARPEPLQEALDSAAGALSSEDELIVVDGDPARSAEPLVAGLQARRPDLQISYIASDPGLPLQRNAGISEAKGEIVVFTDDDCTFGPSFFDDVVAVYGDPAVVGATGFVREPPAPRFGSDTHSWLRWALVGGGRQGTMTSFGFRRPIVQVDRARDVEFMPGSLMTARREVADAVRFDERLTGYALGEDDDFSYRVSRRGRVRYEPAIIVDHNEIGFRTMDRRARDRRQIINRTYLFEKNFARHRRARAAYAVLVAMMFAHRVVNREWDGLRGLADGLAYVLRNGARPEGEPPSATVSSVVKSA